MRKKYIKLALTGIMAGVLFPAALSAYTINGSIVTLEASDRTSDNTSLIQGFLNNATYTKIIIPPGPGNASWPVNPLFFNHSNTEIHLNANTVLEARTGGYPNGSDCVLKAISKNNIKVTGDSGAKILMHKEEYALLPVAEWRHALNFMSCSNVTVSGLTLSNTGGDGIYLGNAVAPNAGYCSNVTMTNVVIDGAARNGLSVISIDGLTITGCTFKNTMGQGNVTANGPWTGIDLEPNYPSERLRNIVIDSCVFLNNGGDGFDLYAPLINGSTGILSMTAQNCTMQGNGRYGIAVARVPASLSDSSSMVFQNCTINDNKDIGILVSSKAREAGTLSFTDCSLKNNNLVGADTPFLINYFYSSDGSEVGGNIQLNNIVIEQPASRSISKFLSIDGTYGLIDNVSGTVHAFGGALSTANTTNINVTHLGLAVDKAPLASSTFDSTCLESKANDGVYGINDPNNCWACGNYQDVGAWWSVDLGQTLPLGKVRVQYRKIGGNYHFVPVSVTIQTKSSENSNWTTVVSKSSNVPQEGAAYNNVLYEYPVGGSARYVRLLFEDGGSTYSGYKLVELVEVEITPPGIAVNKEPLASSTFNGSCLATEANDGLYGINDSNNCWACEDGQDVGAWWSVDLGQTLALGKARIQYRKIGGAYHFVPLSVTVQTKSSDNSNWVTVVSKSANVPQEGAAYSDVLYEYLIGGSARFVRLLFEDGGNTYSGYKIIELTEVEITPPALSANKTSVASSTFSGSVSASKANDGVYLQNDPYNNNCWACGNGQDMGAWWSVDLGKTLALDKVRVQYRRYPNGAYHFVPVSVTVQTKSSENSNWTTVISKSNNVPLEGASGNDFYEYPVGGNARFVRLLFEDGGSTYSGYKFVELVEVEITSCMSE